MQIAKVEKIYSEQELLELDFSLIPSKAHRFWFHFFVTIFITVLVITIAIFFFANMNWYRQGSLIFLAVVFYIFMDRFGDLYGPKKDDINQLLSHHEQKDIIFYDGRFSFYKFSEYGKNIKWPMERGLVAAKIYTNNEDCEFLHNLFKKQEE